MYYYIKMQPDRFLFLVELIRGKKTKENICICTLMSHTQIRVRGLWRHYYIYTLTKLYFALWYNEPHSTMQFEHWWHTICCNFYRLAMGICINLSNLFTLLHEINMHQRTAHDTPRDNLTHCCYRMYQPNSYLFCTWRVCHVNDITFIQCLYVAVTKMLQLVSTAASIVSV
jgi:hypothetical protein